MSRSIKTKIRNGHFFPMEVKSATLAEVLNNPMKRISTVAVERNMSEVTIRGWAKAANMALYSHQHPNTAAGIRAHWARYQANKLFNTPTAKTTYNTTTKKYDTIIEYKGVIYK